MPAHIRKWFTGIGIVCTFLALGFALVLPFLSLPPFWYQLAVGFALIGLQMAIWLGPAMTSRISSLKRQWLIKAKDSHQLSTANIGIYQTDIPDQGN